ncbi:MAG: alpha/beta fold hydrolase, partial [Chloroflexota bacterium]
MAEKKIKIRADKVTLNYRHEGDGKINIIFLHGWSIDSSYWKEQIDLLKDNYSVYALDLPGFGDSKAPERTVWSMEEYALDVRDFIKHLGLENIIIAGHSMSGGIMLDVAVKSSPDEIIGLIAVDTLKSVGIEMTPETRAMLVDYSVKLLDDYQQAVKSYAESSMFTDTTPIKVKERVLKDFSKVDPKVGIATFKGFSANYANIPGKLDLVPQMLYLINSDNVPTNEQGLANHCQNGYELLTLHGTGHYPMIEKPEEFNMLLKGVIDRIVHTFENELIARVTVKMEA